MAKFPAVLLDHFRCSQCYSALSKGPVRCGPDRARVCGRCPASPRDVPNPPLQALLARYDFPCRYSAKGCEQFQPFGDERHEQDCQFKEALTGDDAFETIDPLAIQNITCVDCEKSLSVGPLKLTSQGESVCGRCVDRWEALHTEEVLVRNWNMEFVMQKMPLQCFYYKEGCKRALKWGKVQQHEDFCHYRPYSCPATPHDSCHAVLPAADLFQHFQRQHPTLLLQTPKFQQSLTHHTDTHRLLKFDEKLYLVMTKINVASNRLWLSVSHIGDVDLTKHLKFKLNITNTEEIDHFPSRLKPVQPDLVLRINEETSVPIHLEGLQVFFRQPNLQDVICNITVSQEGSPPTKPMLKICKWEDCKQIGEEGRMARHEEFSCQEREVECKWPKCDFKMSHRLFSRHEDICDHRIISCKWTNCKQELPANQMGSHETTCDERGVKCRFEDCSIKCSVKDWGRHVTQCKQQYRGRDLCWILLIIIISVGLYYYKENSHRELINHETKCDERIVKCRFQDCSIECSGKDWDRHVNQCEHQYKKKYWCEISGCGESFSPPDLARHVLSSHPADIVEGATVIRTYKRWAEWNDVVYLQYDGRLFRGRCVFTSDGAVVFLLELLDAEKFRAEYKCAIKMFHPSDPHLTITRDEECDAWIVISPDVLSPFVENSKIKFEWTIIKK